MKTEWLYTPDEWLNVPEIVKRCEAQGITFIYIVGGRGTGKTYGVFDYVLTNNIGFTYLRRTQLAFDTILTDELNPFNQYNEDHNINIIMKKNTKVSAGIFYGIEQDEIIKPSGKAIGVAGALTTFSKLRGLSGEWMKLFFYDEFIPERHEKKIKGEAAAFFNAYETINRNREFKGQKPLLAIAASNSEDIGCSLFLELGLIKHFMNMEKKGIEVKFMPERKICLIDLRYSEISRKKKEQALYIQTKGTRFYDMSIGNKFDYNTGSKIESHSLKGYNAIAAIGEITIYANRMGDYYISHHKSGNPETFTTDDIGIARFKSHYIHLWMDYMDNLIIFEDEACEIAFQKYFD